MLRRAFLGMFSAIPFFKHSQNGNRRLAEAVDRELCTILAGKTHGTVQTLHGCEFHNTESLDGTYSISTVWEINPRRLGYNLFQATTYPDDQKIYLEPTEFLRVRARYHAKVPRDYAEYVVQYLKDKYKSIPYDLEDIPKSKNNIVFSKNTFIKLNDWDNKSYIYKKIILIEKE